MTAGTMPPSSVTAVRGVDQDLPPRTAYRAWLVEHVRDHPEVVCLDSDTGIFTGVDFGDAADRYVNVGIAEQNLIAAAAGMAAEGLRPYVHTMAAFAASRALEFVKLDVVYNRLPVTVVGTHAGLSAGRLGPTHQALDDLAALRALPGLTVLQPAGTSDLRALLEQAADLPGPVYLRLGRTATPPLPPAPAPVLGRLAVPAPDADVLIVATGPYPVLVAHEAAQGLSRRGVATCVLDAHTLAPFDADELAAAARSSRLVVTVEEHWPVGGLGSLVAEALCAVAPRRQLTIAVPHRFMTLVADQAELLAACGITPERVVQDVLSALSQLSDRPRADRLAVPSQQDQ